MIATQAMQNPHFFSHHTHYIHCLVFARLSFFIHDTQIAPPRFLMQPGQLVAPPPLESHIAHPSPRLTLPNSYPTTVPATLSSCDVHCSLFVIFRPKAMGRSIVLRTSM